MKLLEPGAELDGFTIEACIHAGGMAHIYRVRYSQGEHDPGFALAMKVPRMTSGDGAENIVSFEVEHQMLQLLTGPHVPRFVAAGDLDKLPYLVMEYLTGQTLAHWSEDTLAGVQSHSLGFLLQAVMTQRITRLASSALGRALATCSCRDCERTSSMVFFGGSAGVVLMVGKIRR